VPAVQIVAIHVFLKTRALGVIVVRKKLRTFVLVQLFEVRLAVVAGIHSAELHGTS
jgi:hypothetical protein